MEKRRQQMWVDPAAPLESSMGSSSAASVSPTRSDPIVTLPPRSVSAPHHSVVQMLRDKKRQHVDLALHSSSSNQGDGHEVDGEQEDHNAAAAATQRPRPFSANTRVLPIQNYAGSWITGLQNNASASSSSSGSPARPQLFFRAPTILGLMDEARRRKVVRVHLTKLERSELFYREVFSRNWFDGLWYIHQVLLQRLLAASARESEVAERVAKAEGSQRKRQRRARAQIVSRTLQTAMIRLRLEQIFSGWLAITSANRILNPSRFSNQHSPQRALDSSDEDTQHHLDAQNVGGEPQRNRHLQTIPAVFHHHDPREEGEIPSPQKCAAEEELRSAIHDEPSSALSTPRTIQDVSAPSGVTPHPLVKLLTLPLPGATASDASLHQNDRPNNHHSSNKSRLTPRLQQHTLLTPRQSLLAPPHASSSNSINHTMLSPRGVPQLESWTVDVVYHTTQRDLLSRHLRKLMKVCVLQEDLHRNDMEPWLQEVHQAFVVELYSDWIAPCLQQFWMTLFLKEACALMESSMRLVYLVAESCELVDCFLFLRAPPPPPAKRTVDPQMLQAAELLQAVGRGAKARRSASLIRQFWLCEEDIRSRAWDHFVKDRQRFQRDEQKQRSHIQSSLLLQRVARGWVGGRRLLRYLCAVKKLEGYARGDLEQAALNEWALMELTAISERHQLVQEEAKRKAQEEEMERQRLEAARQAAEEQEERDAAAAAAADAAARRQQRLALEAQCAESMQRAGRGYVSRRSMYLMLQFWQCEQERRATAWQQFESGLTTLTMDFARGVALLALVEQIQVLLQQEQNARLETAHDEERCWSPFQAEEVHQRQLLFAAEWDAEQRKKHEEEARQRALDDAERRRLQQEADDQATALLLVKQKLQQEKEQAAAQLIQRVARAYADRKRSLLMVLFWRIDNEARRSAYEAWYDACANIAFRRLPQERALLDQTEPREDIEEQRENEILAIRRMFWLLRDEIVSRSAMVGEWLASFPIFTIGEEQQPAVAVVVTTAPRSATNRPLSPAGSTRSREVSFVAEALDLSNEGPATTTPIDLPNKKALLPGADVQGDNGEEPKTQQDKEENEQASPNRSGVVGEIAESPMIHSPSSTTMQQQRSTAQEDFDSGSTVSLDDDSDDGDTVDVTSDDDDDDAKEITQPQRRAASSLTPAASRPVVGATAPVTASGKRPPAATEHSSDDDDDEDDDSVDSSSVEDEDELPSSSHPAVFSSSLRTLPSQPFMMPRRASLGQSLTHSSSGTSTPLRRFSSTIDNVVHRLVVQETSARLSLEEEQAAGFRRLHLRAAQEWEALVMSDIDDEEEMHITPTDFPLTVLPVQVLIEGPSPTRTETTHRPPRSAPVASKSSQDLSNMEGASVTWEGIALQSSSTPHGGKEEDTVRLSTATDVPLATTASRVGVTEVRRPSLSTTSLPPSRRASLVGRSVSSSTISSSDHNDDDSTIEESDGDEENDDVPMEKFEIDNESDVESGGDEDEAPSRPPPSSFTPPARPSPADRGLLLAGAISPSLFQHSDNMLLFGGDFSELDDYLSSRDVSENEASFSHEQRRRSSAASNDGDAAGSSQQLMHNSNDNVDSFAAAKDRQCRRARRQLRVEEIAARKRIMRENRVERLRQVSSQEFLNRRAHIIYPHHLFLRDMMVTHNRLIEMHHMLQKKSTGKK